MTQYMNTRVKNRLMPLRFQTAVSNQSLSSELLLLELLINSLLNYYREKIVKLLVKLSKKAKLFSVEFLLKNNSAFIILEAATRQKQEKKKQGEIFEQLIIQALNRKHFLGGNGHPVAV